MIKNKATGRRLPEFRYGYWYRTDGTCIKPETWEFYRVTYLMALLHMLGYFLGGSALVGSIIGFCQVWIWYPRVMTPTVVAVMCLTLFCFILHGLAKDITR